MSVKPYAEHVLKFFSAKIIRNLLCWFMVMLVCIVHGYKVLIIAAGVEQPALRIGFYWYLAGRVLSMGAIIIKSY